MATDHQATQAVLLNEAGRTIGHVTFGKDGAMHQGRCSECNDTFTGPTIESVAVWLARHAADKLDAGPAGASPTGTLPADHTSKGVHE